MKERETYLGGIFKSWRTVMKGMRLSGKHLRKGYKREEPRSIMDADYFEKVDGPITIQYPKEKVALPDNGRYRLHMETDDCIACDKCARICPVDCITIDSFRADGDLGRTSDGTLKRLHLPVFDIDMGKCMYCGLCTTVCPTDCLTMTKVYDYSEYDRDNFVYHFGAYSPEEEDRIRTETTAALEKKKQAKAAEKAAAGASSPAKRRPVRRKPVTADASKEKKEGEAPTRKAPIRRRPVMKPKEGGEAKATEETKSPDSESKAPPKKRARPVMKRKPIQPDETSESQKPEAEQAAEATTPPKKRARPVMKRKPIQPEESPDTENPEIDPE